MRLEKHSNWNEQFQLKGFRKKHKMTEKEVRSRMSEEEEAGVDEAAEDGAAEHEASRNEASARPNYAPGIDEQLIDSSGQKEEATQTKARR